MSSCSFCKSKESDDNRLLAGDENIFVCENCVISAYKIFFGDENKESKKTGDPLVNIDISKLSPKVLKSKLDEYIIGQESAKKVFSVAIYNHYKRLLQDDDVVEIQKSNVLFVGPTGSGKTLLAQTMAKFLNVPLAIADATSLTEAGYVGEDVENIITKLLQAADGDIEKAKKGIIFIDEVDKIARLGENRSITRDVSGEGVQQALLKIIEGSVINVPPKGGRKHPNQEFLQIDTTGILFICGGAFAGIEDIIKKRLGGNILGFNQTKRTKKDEENLLSHLEPDDLVKFGLIPELIGRLHMVGTLNELSEEDMIKILKEPKNSLIKQYQKLFEFDGVKLTFDDDAMGEIATLALKRKTGARGLRTILESIMLDIMYELPEYRGYEIIITKEVVLDKAKPTYIKNKKSA